MTIRVYNYNTLEKVREFEAHSDFIRGLAVHPTQPYILSCSGEYHDYENIENSAMFTSLAVHQIGCHTVG